ncbi:MAG TPA: hypothetical protein VG106_03810 [Vicinamibacterales bacterium]|nr:hypothetical protein [Vicinamibacterales bacterium]
MLRRSSFAAAAGLSLTLLLASCGGDSTAPPRPTVAGAWTGIAPGGATIDLTLSLSGQTVSGNGRIDNIAVTVTGTYTPPSTSLTLSASGFQPVVFAGEVSLQTMIGTLDGSGWDDEPMAFMRDE